MLNYVIIPDISFDVGQVIEDVILFHKDKKMNLGHPFLIYGLCKKVGVPLETNKAWIHLIKAIIVKKNKSDVPRPDEVYDFRNEPSNEEELKAYQTMFRLRDDDIREASQSSTQPPPPASQKDVAPSPSQPIDDQVQDLTTRVDAF